MRTMKIGIDVRPLSRPPAGIHRAVRNVLLHLQEIDSENTYYLYCDREFDLAIQNSRWRRRIGRRVSFLPGSLWLQTDAKRMAVEDGVDVFWGTTHALPFALPSSTRGILTINDLVWPEYSRTMSFYNRVVNCLCFRKSIRRAHVVVVPSQSTRLGMENGFAVPPSQVRTIPYGVENHFQPVRPAVAAARIARTYGVSEDYLCAVGTIEPRKNLATLIEAVRILRNRQQCEAQLLIAGAKGWKSAPLYRRLADSGFTENDVKFLGYVPEEDMPYLYAGASVFVFPSLYEGFGFPALEAMACGAPVVASNASSIPEVVGEAALLFDPHRPAELAEAILRVRSDSALREHLISSGISRAAQFKWVDTARATLAVLTGSD